MIFQTLFLIEFIEKLSEEFSIAPKLAFPRFWIENRASKNALCRRGHVPSLKRDFVQGYSGQIQGTIPFESLLLSEVMVTFILKSDISPAKIHNYFHYLLRHSLPYQCLLSIYCRFYIRIL